MLHVMGLCREGTHFARDRMTWVMERRSGGEEGESGRGRRALIFMLRV
jgi:hypothetical protein